MQSVEEKNTLIPFLACIFEKNHAKKPFLEKLAL
jgi:hypothetical protein